MFGLIGTKKGMTRVFKEDGASIPVTVIKICKSKIVQRKTPEKDGYYGIQINYGSKKKVSKSLFEIILSSEEFTVQTVFLLPNVKSKSQAVNARG